MKPNKIITIYFLLFLSSLYVGTHAIFLQADTIQDINIQKWQQQAKLAPLKKACKNCNFFIASINQDLHNDILMQQDHQESQNYSPQQSNEQGTLTKLVFINTSIIKAYKDILLHKGILDCTYCHTLDTIMPILPNKEKSISYQNIEYSFKPLHNAYFIIIKDEICNRVDTLMFLQDKDSIELWMHTNQCNNANNLLEYQKYKINGL